MKSYLFLTDSTTAAWPHSGLTSDGHYEQPAVIRCLVTVISSVRNAPHYLSSARSSAAVNRSTVGHWAKRVMASETGRAEVHNLPCSGHSVIAVSPEMLPHVDAIVHED